LLADNLSSMDSDDLQRAYEQCRQRYPTIDLSLEDFSARVNTSAAEFDRLCQEDLFLATSCARGDRIAWEYFADDYLPLLHRMAALACRQFQEGEDVAQEIVASLIADKTKIAAYDGRGSLAGWLRVAVSHAAIDRFRRKRREVSLDEPDGPSRDEPSAAPLSNQGEEALDSPWGSVLAKMLEAEIRNLPARDRLILSLYYIENVPLKIIGRQFGVHEATASRWLDKLRRGVRKSVERELRGKHGFRPGELNSLWQWVAEHEEFSLKEVLGPRCKVQGSITRLRKPGT
jgi:RNA polymerase sigma-70 factor (ECF subfamily)